MLLCRLIFTPFQHPRSLLIRVALPTVNIPCNVSVLVAVQNDIPVRIAALLIPVLPLAVRCSDAYPAGIHLTAPIVPADKEVAIVASLD